MGTMSEIVGVVQVRQGKSCGIVVITRGWAALLGLVSGSLQVR
jgi:hypothetical protein